MTDLLNISFASDYDTNDNYMQTLCKENTQFAINRTAYIHYINDVQGGSSQYSFNSFCDSEIGKRYILETLREWKLKRILK